MPVPAGEEYTGSVDAELTQFLIDAEGRASVNEMEGPTLASARARAISAALRAIDLEMEFLGDLGRKLEGNQPQ
jgi:hypothetical protein